MMCPICYEEKPTSKMHQLACKHKAMKECLREYFVTLMDNNNVDKIKCPQETCRWVPSDHEIKVILDDDFLRYQMLIRTKRVAKSNGTLKLCPYDGCTGTVVN